MDEDERQWTLCPFCTLVEPITSFIQVAYFSPVNFYLALREACGNGQHVEEAEGDRASQHTTAKQQRTLGALFLPWCVPGGSSNQDSSQGKEEAERQAERKEKRRDR